MPPAGAAHAGGFVTLQMTETIYKEVTGTGLTIANYFPRNQAAGELLTQLAGKLATSNYSLKTLLVAILETPYFNRKPAEAGCGAVPYTYPNVFDPWVIADADMAKRKNGPGDAVTAVDSRTLVAATNAALGWGPPPAATSFPDYGEPGCEDATCQELAQACAQQQCCATKHAVCDMGGLSPTVELPFERGVRSFGSIRILKYRLNLSSLFKRKSRSTSSILFIGSASFP